MESPSIKANSDLFKEKTYDNASINGPSYLLKHPEHSSILHLR